MTTTSERLQIKKVRMQCSGDEDFALVLFEEEGKYSVVEKERIKEKHYAYNQTVNVLWGKGKDAEHYPGKLVLCGTQDDCEKAALDLTFSSADSASPGKTCTEGAEKGKRRKESAEVEVPAKKSKGTINEEKLRLDRAVETNRQKESLQRSSMASKSSCESEPFVNDLSDIVARLDSIENKLDLVIKQAKSAKYSTLRVETSSPIPKKENVDTSSVVADSDDDEDSDFVYNDVQLLSLKAPPKEPTRYATRLAGVIFSKEEMLAGMVPPLNEKYQRSPLDPDRISLIKRCVVKKYSTKTMEKMWPDIRRAINQKCNDIRKKQTQ